MAETWELQKMNDHAPSRSMLGNRRWTPEEDASLLELVREQEEWIVIAARMNRTFASVQNRYRFLRTSRGSITSIVHRTDTRAQDPLTTPDLSCGALSKTGRQIVEEVWDAIEPIARTRNERELPRLSAEIRLIIGAVIREVILSHLNTKEGWMRVTISQINAVDHGVPREVFRKIVECTEKSGFLERYVGYLGLVKFENGEARKGRAVLLRSTARLRNSVAGRGITADNLYSHFPSLSG